MFKLMTVIFAVVATVSAKPGVLAQFGYSSPLGAFSAPLAYAGSPYANIGGSSQVDIRQNYNAFPAPYFAAPAAYVAQPALASPFAAPIAKYAAPLGSVGPLGVSPYAASPFAAPLSVAPYATSPFAGPLAAGPFAAPIAGSPFATQFKYGSASPFAAAPLKYTAAGPVVL